MSNQARIRKRTTAEKDPLLQPGKHSKSKTMKINIRGLLSKNKNKREDKEDEEILQQWSQREKQNIIEERNLERRAELEEELNPSKYCLHRIYDMIRFITFFAGFLLFVGQLITMDVIHEQVGPVQFILRLYVLLLCVLICFNELECTKFILDSSLLRIWITRGMLYAFVGILGLAENDIYMNSVKHSSSMDNVLGHGAKESGSLTNSTGSSLHPTSALTAVDRAVASQYVQAVSWLIISCGVLYFFMGVFCLQIIVNRLQADYQRRRELAGQSRKLTELTGTGNQRINTDDNDVEEGDIAHVTNA